MEQEQEGGSSGSSGVSRADSSSADDGSVLLFSDAEHSATRASRKRRRVQSMAGRAACMSLRAAASDGGQPVPSQPIALSGSGALDFGAMDAQARAEASTEAADAREVIVLSSDEEGVSGSGEYETVEDSEEAASDDEAGSGALARLSAMRAKCWMDGEGDDDDNELAAPRPRRWDRHEANGKRPKRQRKGHKRQRGASGAVSVRSSQQRAAVSRRHAVRRQSLAALPLSSWSHSPRRAPPSASSGSGGGCSSALRCLDGRLFPLSVLRVRTEGVQHAVFLDGDNWPSFLLALPRAMDSDTLVCCFVGGATQMRLPNDALLVQQADAAAAAAAEPHTASASSLPPCARLIASCRLLVTQCGCTPNASDFAMAVKVGALHSQLPLHVPFTLFSGDKGLDEVLRHTAGRSCTRLDPHAEHVRGEKRQTDELNFALLESVTQR